MKHVKFGNILSAEEGIIMHGCNAQGVMGSGLALEIKQKYPQAYEDYRKAYTTTGLKLGDVIFSQVGENLYVANCITQHNYGRDKNTRYVSYKAIEEVFQTVILGSIVNQHRLMVHYPLIGAGLANGEWSIISQIIEGLFDGCTTPRTLWLMD